MSDQPPTDLSLILRQQQQMLSEMGLLRADMGAMKAALQRLDAEAAAAESRLMARMNDNQERLIERLRSNEVNLLGLTEIARSTNTMIGTIAGIAVDLGRRI